MIHHAVVGKVHSFDPVNLAYGTNITLLDLVGLIEEQLGHPVERVFTAPRVGDVRASQADNSRVRGLFPDVVPVPLEQGLAATNGWFKSEMEESR